MTFTIEVVQVVCGFLEFGHIEFIFMYYHGNCPFGKCSLWKMTCPCTTMENVTMESVTMEKDVVPQKSLLSG